MKWIRDALLLIYKISFLPRCRPPLSPVTRPLLSPINKPRCRSLKGLDTGRSKVVVSGVFSSSDIDHIIVLEDFIQLSRDSSSFINELDIIHKFTPWLEQYCSLKASIRTFPFT